MSELVSPHRTSRYIVNIYSGGQVVRTFDADAYMSHEGQVWINLPDGRRHIVGRSCSVRRTESGPPKVATHEMFYEASLYSGGRVVETVKVNSYMSYKGNVYLTDVHGEDAVLAGTYVIRRIGSHLNVPCDGCNYKVTAFSAGESVGTWFARLCRTGENMLYLYADTYWDVIVGGNFVAESTR